MAAQKGRDFLLKDGTAAAGTTIAGMRTTSVTFNGQSVDVTNKDSAGWRELLAGAGTGSVSISASGVLTGIAQFTTLLSRCVAKSLDVYGLVFDNGDKIDGSWQLTQVQSAGGHDNEQTYDLTLESSGAVTITAV